MFYTKIKKQAKQVLDGYEKNNPASYAAAQQAIGGLLILDGFVGIDNPLGGRKRSGIFGSLIGVILGLVFAFGSGALGNLIGINKLTATTTATIVAVSQPAAQPQNNTNSSSSSSCTPTATYTIGDKTYTQTSKIGSSSACSLTQGQQVQINYDPSNPASWAYDLGSVKAVFKFIPIVGIFVFLVSLVTFVIRLLSIIFGWKLLKSGRALAKTLPEGTDLSTVINEVKDTFSRSMFNKGGLMAAATEAAVAPVMSQAPVAAAAPESPVAPAAVQPTAQATVVNPEPAAPAASVQPVPPAAPATVEPQVVVPTPPQEVTPSNDPPTPTPNV